jgi:hypothetical protein
VLNPSASGALTYTVAATAFTSFGAITFTGAMYYHNSSCGDQFAVNGGAGTTTFALGQIIADTINLSGRGTLKIALGQGSAQKIPKAGIPQ